MCVVIVTWMYKHYNLLCLLERFPTISNNCSFVIMNIVLLLYVDSPLDLLPFSYNIILLLHFLLHGFGVWFVHRIVNGICLKLFPAFVILEQFYNIRCAKTKAYKERKPHVQTITKIHCFFFLK